MRTLLLTGALLGAFATASLAQSPTLDTKLSVSTAKPGQTIRLSADLANLTPASMQRAAFFGAVRQRPRPGPRRRPLRRFGFLLGTAPLVQSGRIYTATLSYQIPSRISRDITINITAVTVDRSGPRPRLVIGDTEALMIDAP